MGFFEDVEKLEKAIQAQAGPKARLKWQPLYYKAHGYFSRREIEEMSYDELSMRVGERARIEGEKQRQQTNGQNGGRPGRRGIAEEEPEKYQQLIDLAIRADELKRETASTWREICLMIDWPYGAGKKGLDSLRYWRGKAADHLCEKT